MTALYGMANDGSNVALSQSERERLNVRHRVAISLKNTEKLDKYDVLAVPVERQIFSRYGQKFLSEVNAYVVGWSL